MGSAAQRSKRMGLEQMLVGPQGTVLLDFLRSQIGFQAQGLKREQLG